MHPRIAERIAKHIIGIRSKTSMDNTQAWISDRFDFEAEDYRQVLMTIQRLKKAGYRGG